jgi:anthranilate phosphoribosyltransferase
MTSDLLDRLIARRDLSDPDVRSLVEVLVAPDTPDALRAALLVALRAKGETVGEIAAFARELRARATAVPWFSDGPAVDLCGSGGAPKPSFNVSTASAFVVASAGLPVVKHGNRSARNVTGSSDLLEALGLGVILRSREFAAKSFRLTGLAFLHAPLYHTATRAVAGVRRALGIPTVFNLLGPLTNPARVPYQLVGASDAASARVFVRALSRLGVRSCLAVTSEEGCDEFSPKRPSAYWRPGANGALRPGRADPSRLLRAPERSGGWGMLAPPDAARATEELLRGETNARRGAVLMTSGAALWVAGRARDFDDGVGRARSVLDGGRPAELLERFRDLAASREWPEPGG